MKKIVSLFLTLIFVGFSLSSYSQTAQQTLSYLQTYYTTIRTTFGKIEMDYSGLYISEGIVKGSFLVISCERMENGTCVKYGNTEIKCETITGISLYFQPYILHYDNGESKTETDESWRLEIHYFDGQTELLQLPPNDKNYAVRLKNAIIKLAKYSGAKITDENLFN